jgi:DNA-directed RNA polymerase subunit A'
MEVQEQVFSPKDGNTIMAGGEDSVIGLYMLTQDYTYLDKGEAEYLLGMAGIRELPKQSKNKMYSGKSIFSMLLPKGLSFETNLSEGEKFVIKDGELAEGNVTKKIYGLDNKLFVAIAMEYDFDVLREFMAKSTRLAYAYATLFGVTMGVKEYVVSDEITKEKEKLLEEARGKVKEMIEQYRAKKFEPLLGLTMRQSLEQSIMVELDLSRGKASQLLRKSVDKTNFAMLMANSGARANILNFEQMSLFLGGQATLQGKRIKRGYYTKRVIPHLDRNDIGPLAGGFIESSYVEGLSPIEMMMHAIGGRGSVIQKGLITQRSGYLQRRLANALQDYYVAYDSSVRDAGNNMVQTVYGGDGVNPTKVNFTKEKK